MRDRIVYQRDYYRRNSERMNARRRAWRWACWLVHQILFAADEPQQALTQPVPALSRRPLLTLRGVTPDDIGPECEQCGYDPCRCDEEWDPYEAAGESRFGLPGGGKSL